MATYILKQLVDRENAAIRRYYKALAKEDIDSIKAEFQSIVDAYDKLITAAPGYAPAYVSYGHLLETIGETQASYAMFAKADEIDPNIAMVKNQLGNYMAEQGQYAEALAYFLMAIEIKPDEPLYHFQVGNLLHSYRRLFIDDKLYLPATIDLKIQEYFREAALLAPTNFQYRLGYGQSFFDVENPNWYAALEEWQQMIEIAGDETERQLVLLYTARVRSELGHFSAAEKLLKKVDHPDLQETKETLIDGIKQAKSR